MAQLVKPPTLDFGSGHDLAVLEFKPCVRHHIADRVEPAWDSLSAPSPLVHVCVRTLSLNK